MAGPEPLSEVKAKEGPTSKAPDTQSRRLLWLSVASPLSCGLGPSRAQTRTTSQACQGVGLLPLPGQLELSPVCGSGFSPGQNVAAKAGVFHGALIGGRWD